MSSEEQKQQIITLHLSVKNIRTLCFAALVIILYAAFQYNFFRIIGERGFHGHDRLSESFILNRIVENRHAGFAPALIVRNGTWEHDSHTAVQSAYDDYFLNRKPTRGSWTYGPSAGLQGWVYAPIDAALRLFDMSGKRRLKYMHRMTALALALTLSAIILWIGIEFGFIAAVISLVSIISFPTLTQLGRNLYWMPFSWFLPMLWCWRYYVLRSPPERRDFIIFSIGFAILAGIKMLANFDYMPVMLMASGAVVVYGVSRHGFIWRNIFRHGFLLIATSIVTFFIALFITTMTSINKSERGGYWFGKINDRTYGDVLWVQGTSESSAWDVVKMHLTGDILGIPLIFLFSFLLLSGLACLLLIAFQDKDWRNRFWISPLWQRSAAVYLFGLLSFLAPVISFIVYKNHSYAHAMVFIFWSLPTLLILPATTWALVKKVKSQKAAIGTVLACLIIAPAATYSMNRPVVIYSHNVLKHKEKFLTSVEKIDNKTLQPIIISKFNVYFDPDEKWLIYKAKGIVSPKKRQNFFLHVFAEDPNMLKRKKNIEGGVEYLHQSPLLMDYIVENDFRGYIIRRKGTFFWKLPDYKIKAIRTGQFIERENAPPEKRWHNFWEGKAEIDE